MIHALHALREAVILIGHLVLPRAEAPAAVDPARFERGKNGRQRAIATTRRRRVPVRQTTVPRMVDGGAIPMIMNNDEDAIRLAVKTVVRVKPQDCKIVRIRNTLELVDIHVSEPLMAQVRANSAQFEVIGQPEALKFDTKGLLYPMLGKMEAQKVDFIPYAERYDLISSLDVVTPHIPTGRIRRMFI